MTLIQKGEIRHVTRNPEVIVKVAGPFNSEAYNQTGNVVPLNLFIQTNEFPRYHYIVILDKIESYTAAGHYFFLARLITHSNDYDNLKITEVLYDKSATTLNLKNSFITRDIFLVPESEVLTDKSYGRFDLTKLNDALIY